MSIYSLNRVIVPVCTLLLFFFNNVTAQQIAFPTAEGAGRFTTGGRGTATVATTVFEVTNLNDDNVIGSLRYALNVSSSTAPYRTIVFRVSGTIHLTSRLPISRANTTIAGQTAPGDGICIADYPVSISASNLIVRYIRFRLGDKNQNLGMVNGSGNDDAFSGTGQKNIIIDHCTMGWSNDESFTIYSGDSTTAQWNMIAEPLNYSYHFETGDTDFEHHGFGGIWGGRRSSFHHNLIAHIKGRGPRFDGCRNLSPNTPGLENVDFRNNIIYNWSDYNVNGGEGGNYNVVNNYYKYGLSTTSGSSSGVSKKNMLIWPSKQTTAPILPYGKFYLTGNYVDSLPGIPSYISHNNWRGAAMYGGTLADTVQSKVETPFDISPLNTESALDAYISVLAGAGATLPKRDTLDERIVNDVKNRTGTLIDVQGNHPHGTPYAQTVNAWPTLNSLPAPADTDHDGMPDAYETANGSDPNNAADRNVYAANGYTRLENYLNNISAAALPLNLLSFKAIAVANEVQVSWTTSNEENIKMFEVEKGMDGVKFLPIGSAVAKNTPQTNSYNFNDKNLSAGVSFYRLKMNDKNGLFTYSKIVTITNSSSHSLIINPNPVLNSMVISHPVANTATSLSILNIAGKLMRIINVSMASTQTSVNLSNFSKGKYIVVFKDNTQKLTTQFLKQ